MTHDNDSSCLPVVLCVDDEPGILQALERTLHHYGCQVLTAQHGAAALDLLQRHQVDVIVCDEAMPGLRGTDLLRAAKELSPHAVRILLTGHCGDTDVMLRAVNGGEIFRLLPKPWDDAHLRLAIADALGSEPLAWRHRRQHAAERLKIFGAAGRSRPAVEHTGEVPVGPVRQA